MSARKKGPMPAERVKSDWKGQSPDVLMAKGDLLPPGVRDCPRAFIVPARESGGRAKSRAFHANEAQRLSQSSPQPPQPWQGYSHSPFMPPFGPPQPVVYTLPPPPPPPPAVVPARYPVTGYIAPAFWSPQPAIWTPQYGNSHQVPYPQAPYPQMPYSQVPYPHVSYPPQMPAPQQPQFPYPAPPPTPSPVVSMIYTSLLPLSDH
jgi:hypothetical protein